MFTTLLTFLNMDASHFVAALLVGFYAVQRFNTPRTVRSQTSRFQYFGSSVIYVMSSEGVLFLVTWALQQQGAGILQILHIGAEGNLDAGTTTLEAPLLAALMLTTLLPSFPLLRDIDERMLRLFHRIGAIPFNAVRWSQLLEYLPFTVTDDGLAAAKRHIQANVSLPDELLRQLTQAPNADRLRYGFTRVVVLYVALHRQACRARFADAFQEDVAAFEKKMNNFFAHCVGYFVLVEQLCRQRLQPAVNAAEDITKVIAETDSEVRLMLARLLLYSCNNESGMSAKLMDVGFSIDRRKKVVLPHNLLVADLLGVVALFIVATWISTTLSTNPVPVGKAIAIGLMVATNHSIAAAFAVLPKQLWSFADRRRCNERPVLAYALSGLCALTIAVPVSYCFYVMRVHTATESAHVLPFAAQCKWLLLSMSLSMALAFCCDNYLIAARDPKWLRLVEGVGTAVFIGAIGALIVNWVAPDVHVSQGHSHASHLMLPVLLSAAIGALFGGTIPHWYRKSVRAA